MLDRAHKLPDSDSDSLRDILDDHGLYILLINAAELAQEQAEERLEERAARAGLALLMNARLVAALAAQLATRPLGATATVPLQDLLIAALDVDLRALVAAADHATPVRTAAEHLRKRLLRALDLLGGVPPAARAQLRGLKMLLRFPGALAADGPSPAPAGLG